MLKPVRDFVSYYNHSEVTGSDLWALERRCYALRTAIRLVRSNKAMFVVILEYVADLAEIDAALPAHGTWLEEQYERGLFIASGRREPRTGGIILANGTRKEVETAIAADPFAMRKLARHTVIEFHPSKFGGPLDTQKVRDALG